MRAGVSTASLFLRVNTEDALALLGEWGVKEAEVFLTSFCEYSEKFARLLKTKARGIRVNSVHALGTQFEPQLFAEHPRVVNDAYTWLRQFLAAAKILGADYYSFHGLARMKRSFRDDIQKRAEKLRAICDECEKYGVKLCLENVEWAYYNRPGIFRALKKECPSLLGVLDIKQARISGFAYQEYLAEMGQSIAYVHVSDIGADGKMCLPGRGIFNFDELFARLRDVGFQGDIILENYGGDYGDLGELKTAYEFLAEKAEKFS
ncbi:MAG: sugar phosphate isomerase/epimerase [Clostridia bacterium]|nr:sugar phosphate isomerase/epimerase [Clostridia bacterium]